MVNKGLLEEAQQRYPIGTTFYGLNTAGGPTKNIYTIIGIHFYYYDSYSTCIADANGNGLLYANGKWAKIITSGKLESYQITF